jgi:anti-anti-sigma factor
MSELLDRRAIGQAERVTRGLVVTRRDDPDEVWLTLHGEIDVASAPALQAMLQRIISTVDHSIVVDLGEVTFIDPPGITALITAREAAGNRLRLGSLHRSVQRAFALTGLIDVANEST